MANYQNYVVRLWNLAGDKVFGWLGVNDSYAACIPAGVYCNPLKLDNVVAVQWRAPSGSNQGTLIAPDPEGDWGLGGKNTDGVDAYWHWADDAYTLTLNAVPGVKLESPVPGAFSGTLSQTRGGQPFALSTNYQINEDVVWISFQDTPNGPDELFSRQEVYLDFTTEPFLFEFVPVQSFDPTRGSYEPGLKSKHSNWRKIDTFSWMGDLKGVIGGRALSELAIPGSHDAASWDITIPGGDQRSQTQSRDIYGQLRAGSRYLDLRFRADCGGVWRGNHGSDWTTAELTSVLADIRRFLHENADEILVISLLPSEQPSPFICTQAGLPYKPAPDIWDVVLNAVGDMVYPRIVVEKDAGGKDHVYYRFIQNVNQNIVREQGKNIILFSWGKPPTGTVTVNDKNKATSPADLRQDHNIWIATPEGVDQTAGDKPWEGAFKAAEADHYAIDFDRPGVWINGYSTTANDLRLVIDAVEPPTGGPLWLMHCNVPAAGGGESIKTKADRIQPPLNRLVREDPVMTSKLNIVNLDFVGDHLAMTLAVIEANLLR